MMRYSLICLMLLAAGARAQDMPLSQILIANEGWHAVEPKITATCVAADAQGHLLIADRAGSKIWERTKDGLKEFARDASVSSMCWSPEGALLTVEANTIYRRAPGTQAKQLATRAHDLAVSPTGAIYYTTVEPVTSSAGRLIRRVGDDKPLVTVVPSASGMVFWNDGGTLVVGEAAGNKLFAYRVGKDGGLDAREGYYTLRTRGKGKPSAVTALTEDTDGRLYAATERGVQVFDPTGRLCGVLVSPVRAAVTSLAFAGPARDQLYIVCDGKVYTRKTKAKGFVPKAK